MPRRSTLRRALADPHQWRKWLVGLVGSRYDGLHHFSVVEPGILMRCGQPRLADLERIRKEHGLSTVICARGGTRHPLRGRWFAKERDFCGRSGLRFEHMPFSDATLPPAELFDRFVRIVRAPENGPVLVHCEQGFHRSGLLCAAYRVAVGGWLLEDALAEMRRFGFAAEDRRRQALLDALSAWARQRSA